DDPSQLELTRLEARRVGAALSWPTVGAATLRVLEEAATLGPLQPGGRGVPALRAPAIRPDHLLTLVDDVGIIQHANGVVANRSTGYCVDDVARLAVVSLGLDRQLSDPRYARMLGSALAFLQHAWDCSPVGMRNFMSYDRRWIDGPEDGDHLGRAAWALGEVIGAIPARPEAGACLRLLEAMAPALLGSLSPREAAFTVLGLARLDAPSMPAALHELLRVLGGRLHDWYRGCRTEEWRWFEEVLSYDNARLPHALIAAGYRLEEADWQRAGLEALNWYAAQCGITESSVRMIGNQWRLQLHPVPTSDEGDEQPLETASLVEALVEAMVSTGDHAYGVQAVHAFEWFLGRNRFGVPVYDFASGGCHDGIGSAGVNANEGAESTLAFLQALLSLNGAGLQFSLPSR
ncbi:MAG TPA: hypothetical protein VFU98_17560, partial [Microlunatus sp.]|nr:hypothetical protein [Microlunatus sp.]